MGLATYRKKRHFQRTTEPRGKRKRSAKPGLIFVVQKHAARSLHYDFRLELEGSLKSWAVPKGPSLIPGEKRLAVHVEDHPIEYADFEGRIPEGEYGAGQVEIWDRGVWIPEGDPAKDYPEGKLKFRLEGEKLRGRWMLVRMGGRAGEGGKNWLLIKEKDQEARSGKEGDIVARRPESVGPRGKRSPSARRRPAAGRAAGGRRKGGRRRAARRVDPSTIEGARKGPLPAMIGPQLATLVSAVPEGEGWVHEIKFDGYRILCRLSHGNAWLRSRRGNDWTETFSALAGAAAGLPAREAFLDGEVVALDEKGVSSFQALQNALSGEKGKDLAYYVFDLLHLDGYDLRAAPLLARKKVLAALLDPSDPRIRYCDHLEGQGKEFHAQACQRGLEGIVSKKKDAPYRSGRTGDWQKVKCFDRQEFVIGGFTEPEGSRPSLGALLLGVHDSRGRLLHAGRVGTGFTTEVLRDLRRRLEKIERKSPPFADPPAGAESRGVHWTEPRLVAEVSFTGWTRDGMLRHPSFQGLREDKSPSEVVRELPVSPREAREDPEPPVGRDRAGRTARGRGEAEVAGVRITNPERVLYPEIGLTKLDLARFYEEISSWILPHITGRPLVVVRCPEGHRKACFYQKHATAGFPEAIPRVEVEEEGGDAAPYFYIRDLAGLIHLVQMGVLEFHPWGARIDRLEKPDRMFLDLDPGPGVEWKLVIETARHIRERLSIFGLKSFLKTTGGKGLHVVVPLSRRNTWEEVKAFSAALAEELVRLDPGFFIARAAKASRQGKIFVDYLRNSRGATAVAPYSTRARPGAPVSTPIAWEELDGRLRSDHFTVANLPDRLRVLKEDPWKGFCDLRQAIRRSMLEKLRRG